MKKTRTIIPILLGVLAWTYALFPVDVNWYFEHQYFCSVEWNSIVVTLQTGQRYCFAYIRDFSLSIQNINEQRETAQSYIKDGEDVAYRNTVDDQLRMKKQQMTDLQQQFLAAIEDYENNLFLRIKWILNYYFRQTRLDLTASIDQTRQLLLYTKLAGERDKYELLLLKLEAYLQRMQLLDQIRFSQQFDQLIPPLKSYLRLLEERPITPSNT